MCSLTAVGVMDSKTGRPSPRRISGNEAVELLMGLIGSGGSRKNSPYSSLKGWPVAI
jgi:hypothetical protein